MQLLPSIPVPRVIIDIEVTESFNPIVHPRCDAKSPTAEVNIPMDIIPVKKHAQPPIISIFC